jgi:hypothetical protein
MVGTTRRLETGHLAADALLAGPPMPYSLPEKPPSY